MLNFDNWLTGYTLFGFMVVAIFSVLLLMRISGPKASEPMNFWPWLLSFFGILLYMRLPFIGYNKELDIDESQMLAQALSLKKYWIYWKYVDGTTQGPLTSYFLIVPTWLGMSFDYTMARLTGFIFLSLTLTATFLTFRNLYGRDISLVICVPTGFFYLLSQGSFATLYNEYAVLVLLAICFWLFSILYCKPKPDYRILFWIGFVSGMVPFAKLQGVPSALLIASFTGILVLSRSKKRAKDLSMLMLGGICFPFVVSCLAIRFDSFFYFWQFYVIGNMEYSNGVSLLEKALNFLNFLRKSGQFLYLLGSYVLLTVYITWMLLRSGFSLKSLNLLLSFGLLHVLVAFYAIIKSGYLFPHYMQFLIIPIGLFTGALLQGAQKHSQWPLHKVRYMCVLWLLVCLAPHLVGKLKTVTGYASIGFLRIKHQELGKPLPLTAVSQEILKYARAGEDLTVWGWNPAYHLETRLSQGTGDNQVYRLLNPSAKQKEYQDKFLDDLKRTKPVVFVDQITTSSNWFNDPSLFKHERISGIGDYIARHYTKVSTVKEERIYVRNDRVATH